MDIEFYDVRKRAKVSVPSSQVKKKKYERQTKNGTTQVRYAVRASVDGTNLTKFVSKDFWESLSAPTE